MENKNKVDWRSKFAKKQIFTIPNILSFFRLILIPLIIWLYCYVKSPELTLLFIIISGITDVVDGIIARRLNMITDFGKALDPIADKLTQGAVLICLLTRFPLMALLLIIMVVKEVVAFVLRLLVFRKTEKVYSAEWHGKLNTVILYLVMSLHIIWYNIPTVASIFCIVFSSIIMLLSFVLYTVSIGIILIKVSRKKDVVKHEHTNNGEKIDN